MFVKSFILFLFFVSHSAYAEIFHWLDANGNKHYSDKPHQGAQTLQVNSGYSYYQIKKVYDGDTILLSNGQKVRFLGVNTPEVEGRNKLAQAGGDEAKRWLSDKLKDKKVRLEKDLEKKDKYGRLLAHIHTEDGEHINLALVKLGLASVNIHPPNLKYSHELLLAEQQAEVAELGIWSYKDYAVKPVSEIKQSSFRGWQRVAGEVKSVHHSSKNSYLNLSSTFAVKIERKAINLFPKLESYVGKQVEVRGWINKHKNRYSLFIRHPSAIKTH